MPCRLKSRHLLLFQLSSLSSSTEERIKARSRSLRHPSFGFPRRAAPRLHFVSNPPEIVKDRFEERLLQERHAR